MMAAVPVAFPLRRSVFVVLVLCRRRCMMPPAACCRCSFSLLGSESMRGISRRRMFLLFKNCYDLLLLQWLLMQLSSSAAQQTAGAPPGRRPPAAARKLSICGKNPMI